MISTLRPRCDCGEHVQCPCDGKKCKLCLHDPRHGTLNGYTNCFCHCEACRTAQANYCYKAKSRRTQKGPPDHMHGTPGAYGNWGCRCNPCTKAWSADIAERSRRSKAGKTMLVVKPKPRGSREALNK